ncbi:MAG: hypothetical protein P4L48_22805 [Mycobacterium sp.]|nr:hypothetical protein [Mycobacterium sp.]
MAKWRWADLSAAAKLRPIPVAEGNPFAYGVPDCSQSGEFDTSGCPIRIARVVYRALYNELYEIFELSLVDGQWQCNNLCSDTYASNAPASGGYDPTAYVSVWNGLDEGVATVNYVAGDSDIYQIFMPPGWLYQNISNNDGTTPDAMPAAGRAFGYWDFRNAVDRVVYLGLPDHEIYELSNQNRSSWVCNNLSTNDKTEPPAPTAAGNPMGYCLDIPRVYYRGTDGHIYELHPEPFWKWQDLSRAAGGAPQARSDPYVYATDIIRVIYADTAGQIIELMLEERWKWANLSTNDKSASAAPAAAGNPFGYVTSDGIPRVIYRGTDGHIYELHPEPFWKWQDLSSASGGAPQAQSDPFGYEIVDNIPRVVYTGANSHIYELALY